MKLLQQLGQIVLVLLGIAFVGGLIVFTVVGAGAIAGIQAIGNILMPTDENGRYLCAGLNSWDEGVCDTSQNTFGLNGINGMLAGTGLIIALLIATFLVAFIFTYTIAQIPKENHPVLMTIIELPLLVTPAAWLIATYRHNWLMITLSVIICLAGISFAYSLNGEAKKEDLSRYAINRPEPKRPEVQKPPYYVDSYTSLRTD